MYVCMYICIYIYMCVCVYRNTDVGHIHRDPNTDIAYRNSRRGWDTDRGRQIKEGR